MPRSDDYAAGYRAGVEAAAARCRACAEDMRGLRTWRYYAGPAGREAPWHPLDAISGAIAPIYDNAAREIEKLLKEPTT